MAFFYNSIIKIINVYFFNINATEVAESDVAFLLLVWIPEDGLAVGEDGILRLVAGKTRLIGDAMGFLDEGLIAVIGADSSLGFMQDVDLVFTTSLTVVGFAVLFCVLVIVEQLCAVKLSLDHGLILET